LTLYAESSAVLAWVLGEPTAASVSAALAAADVVLCSELTLVECERAIIRAGVVDGLSSSDAAARRAQLVDAAAAWGMISLDSDVLDRARQPFPGEPIRTLDALHLASALVARAAQPDTVLLSLDHRVRRAGELLGFVLAPD
jgi:predicted nucleic acid-binding protein